MPRGHLTEVDRLRIQVTKLKNSNRRDKARIITLEAEIVYLKEENAKKDLIIQHLLLRIEDLERIIFGKKKKKEVVPKDEDNEPPAMNPKAPRSAESYHRPIPKPEDITREEHHPLPSCTCGTILGKQRLRTYFMEDIILPT